MQQRSAELAHATSGDYVKVDKVKLVRNGAVILELEVSAGAVDADNTAEFMRRFTAELPLPADLEDLVPYDLDDPAAPFGTEAIVESGARIPVMEERSLVVEDAAGWNAGTHSNTVVSGNSLVLGYT